MSHRISIDTSKTEHSPSSSPSSFVFIAHNGTIICRCLSNKRGIIPDTSLTGASHLEFITTGFQFHLQDTSSPLPLLSISHGCHCSRGGRHLCYLCFASYRTDPSFLCQTEHCRGCAFDIVLVLIEPLISFCWKHHSTFLRSIAQTQFLLVTFSFSSLLLPLLHWSNHPPSFSSSFPPSLSSSLLTFCSLFLLNLLCAMVKFCGLEACSIWLGFEG